MMKSNKGFTAIEVVIGIGLTALLGAVLMTTQIVISNDQNDLRKNLEDSIDTTLAERILFKDLNGIDPSYNNVNGLDDSGYKFFDFYPDVPANSLTNPLAREVNLSLSGKKEFTFIVQDLKAGPLMTYDPTAAYKIGSAPADFNKSASLTFQSLNQNNWITQQRPFFWEKGRLLLLDTPARIRPLNVAGYLDMNVPPRSPIFAGQVSGAALLMDSTVKGILNVGDPETGSSITNADTFLRRAPSVGGGQPVIRLRAVKLVKYYLEPMKTKTPVPAANLFKTVYENGKWSTPVLIADRVSLFTLRRDSVLKRMIYFNIKKIKV